MRNHLDVDPKAKITVVAHANGVDFLMEGAKDKNGRPVFGPGRGIVNRGVKFEICEITLKNRDLKKEQFLQEATSRHQASCASPSCSWPGMPTSNPEDAGCAWRR